MNQPLLDKKILIAEDEPAMLAALTDKFKREGCIVVQAENGEVALDLAAKEKPDIILLDILMPKKSGMEVLNDLRKGSDWGKTVPVIILTNLSQDESIMGGIAENKPLYYLVKSDWKLYEVVEKVQDCFK
jgi:two-component system alkaline phosphatase synthesis response regulator PhoP